MDLFTKALSTPGLLGFPSFFLPRTEFPYLFYSYFLYWLHRCSPSLLTMNHAGFLTYVSFCTQEICFPLPWLHYNHHFYHFGPE